jgi:hypothetical protein
VLLPQLRQHLQQHGTFKRSFLSYSIYISSTSLLCDTRVYAQWCQGVLTCYLCTLWLLEADQLPLKKLNDTKWPRQGPPAVCRSNKIVMQMSIAGAQGLMPLQLPPAVVTANMGNDSTSNCAGQYPKQRKGQGTEGAWR